MGNLLSESVLTRGNMCVMHSDEDQPARSRLDELDRRILRLFLNAPHIGVLGASRELGVARGTVTARLARLEQRGVIRTWGPRLDPARMGYPVTAFVTLQVHQTPGHESVSAHLASIPQVIEAHTTTGDGDLLARVVAASNRDLQDVVDAVVAHPNVARASTVIALDERVPARSRELLRD